jgi:hypothetical protein
VPLIQEAAAAAAAAAAALATVQEKEEPSSSRLENEIVDDASAGDGSQAVPADSEVPAPNAGEGDDEQMEQEDAEDEVTH